MDLTILSTAAGSLDTILQKLIVRMERENASIPRPRVSVSVPKPLLRLMSGQFGVKLPEDEKPPIRRKTIVSIRVVFMNIGTIDTIHDRYSATIMLQAKWLEPSLNGTQRADYEADLKNCWNPKLSVSNLIGDPSGNSEHSVIYDKLGRATVIEKQKVSGNFFEFMELNKFPFDKQDLTISVSSEWDGSEIELKEDEENPCAVNMEDFASSQEWSLVESLNIWTRDMVKKMKNGEMHHYPCLCVSAKVSRKPQFFLWNIVIVLFAISSLSFGAFVIQPEKPESRLSLTFTLVLTTVTFKLVVNKHLPKISYLTYLDRYILGTMIILASLCVWHAIVGSAIYNLSSSSLADSASYNTTTITADDSSGITTTQSVDALQTICSTAYVQRNSTEFAKTVDKTALGLFGAAYIALHVIFGVLILCESGSDDGLNVEVMETSQTELSMGADTGDLLSPRAKESNERRRGEGATAEQQNFVIAAFGD